MYFQYILLNSPQIRQTFPRACFSAIPIAILLNEFKELFLRVPRMLNLLEEAWLKGLSIVCSLFPGLSLLHLQSYFFFSRLFFFAFFPEPLIASQPCICWCNHPFHCIVDVVHVQGHGAEAEHLMEIFWVFFLLPDAPFLSSCGVDRYYFIAPRAFYGVSFGSRLVDDLAADHALA